MSKLNLVLNISAYEGDAISNSPTMYNVKWGRELKGIDVSEPESKSLNLEAGGSIELFSGSIALNSDNTTTWDIALKSGSSNVYRISHNSGTSPDFRTKRTSGADDTTEVQVTRNAKLAIFTSVGGTNLDLIANGVQVGDVVRIGSGFNANSQGQFKIIALTATSFTVENEIAVAENLVLGTDFDEDINIYSNAGVQVGDKVEIQSGFSSVSFGTYEVVDVSHNYVDFYSSESLPSESGITNTTPAFSLYGDAKQFIYVESNKKVQVIINESTTPNTIEPFLVNGCSKSGVFMSKSTIKSCTIENTSQDNATIFYVLAE